MCFHEIFTLIRIYTSLYKALTRDDRICGGIRSGIRRPPSALGDDLPPESAICTGPAFEVDWA